MIEGLVDNRNANLLEELMQNYTIEVALVNNTNEYGCYSIDYKSTIYVPKSNISAASFTHELLHIYLRSKGMFIGARLKRKFNLSKKLSMIFTEPLLEHMGNCLDHIKMLPIFLELGYERKDFIHDFEKDKLTTIEVTKIKEYWRQGHHENAQVIEFYLEKYFAAKACPNVAIDYSNKLQELRELDEQLFLINEKMINRWRAMKIEREDDLEEDYIIIAEEYIAEMKNWIKPISIK